MPTAGLTLRSLLISGSLVRVQLREHYKPLRCKGLFFFVDRKFGALTPIQRGLCDACDARAVLREQLTRAQREVEGERWVMLNRR